MLRTWGPVFSLRAKPGIGQVTAPKATTFGPVQAPGHLGGA